MLSEIRHRKQEMQNDISHQWDLMIHFKVVTEHQGDTTRELIYTTEMGELRGR